MSKIYFFPILLLLSALFSSADIRANHILGGYITYKHDTLDRYEVYYHIYRQCDKLPISGTADGKFYIYFGKNNNAKSNFLPLTGVRRISINEVSYFPNGINGPCNPSNDSTASIGTELHIFKTSIDLSNSSYKSFITDSMVHYVYFAYVQDSINNQDPIVLISGLRIRDLNGNVLKTYNSSPEMDIDHDAFVRCYQEVYRSASFHDPIDFDSTSNILVPKICVLPNTSCYYPAPFTYLHPITPFCIPSSSITCKFNSRTNPIRGFNLFAEGQVLFVPTNCSEESSYVYRTNEFRKINGKIQEVGFITTIQPVIVRPSVYNKSPKIRAPSTNIAYVGGDSKILVELTDETFTPHQPTPDTTRLFYKKLPKSIRLKVLNPKGREKDVEVICNPSKEWEGKTIRFSLGVADDNDSFPAISTRVISFYVLPSRTRCRFKFFLDKNDNGTFDSSENIASNVPFQVLDSSGNIANLTSNSRGELIHFLGKGFNIPRLSPFSKYFTNKKLDTLWFERDNDTLIEYQIGLHHFPIIKGRLYADKDTNCIFSQNDKYSSGGKIYSKHSLTYSEFNGYFETIIDTTLTSLIVSAGIDSCSLIKSLDSFKMGIDSIHDVGSLPIHAPFDLKNLISMNILRRGRNARFRITTLNRSLENLKYYRGNMPTYLRLEYPPNIKISVSGYTSLDTTLGIVNWLLPDINANEITAKWGRFFIPPNAYSTGDILPFKLSITGGFTDSLPGNNNFTSYYRVVGPYDPNEKLVTSKDSIIAGDEIVYHIDFQNYGTDTAFNVVLIDTLDKQLDVRSFEMLLASHPTEVSINRGIVKFNIPNAQLTDTSTSIEKSKGFVQFRINSLPNIDKQITINNVADIYFDYEKPIRTNTAVVQIMPNVETVALDSFHCTQSKMPYKFRTFAHEKERTFEVLLWDEKELNNWVVKTLILNPGNKWYLDSLNIPSDLHSGRYKIEVRIAGLKTGFNRASSLFEVEKPQAQFTIDSSFCEEELVRLEFNMGHLGKYVLNTSQKNDTMSKSHTFRAKLGQETINVSAITAKGCPYNVNDSFTVWPKPSLVYSVTDTICFGQQYSLKLRANQFYDVLREGNSLYTNTSDSIFPIRNKGNETIEVFAHTNHGCADSVTIKPAVFPLPAVELTVPTFICRLDSVELEFNKISHAQYVHHNGAVWPVSSLGKNYIGSIDTGHIVVYASTQMNCRDSFKFAAPKREILRPKLNTLKDTVCYREDYELQLNANGNYDAKLYRNGAFNQNMESSVSFTGTQVGENRYRVHAINRFGCLYKSNVVSVQTLPDFNVSIIRIGDSLIVPEFVSVMYWTLNGNKLNNLRGKPQIRVYDTGTYTVRCHNYHNCEKEATFQVQTLSVNRPLLRNGHNIVPNPNHGTFKIPEINSFYITNALGQKVDYIKNGNFVSLKKPIEGTYFLHQNKHVIPFVVQ